MSDKQAGPGENAVMTYEEFQDEVKNVFGRAWNFEDLTGKGMGAPTTHFKCVVMVGEHTIELRLSNPYHDHWNCWSETPISSEREIVVGATTAQDALINFKAKLER